MHPRNRHARGYDFAVLRQISPALSSFVKAHLVEGQTIDFADPAAVLALNRALLRLYGIRHWDLPEGYLCPGIPGRADYIHYVADLLSEDHRGVAPSGPAIRVLDLGTGANCVYPIIGSHEYGWNFVGSDVDPVALQSARAIVARNNSLREKIEIRQQRSPLQIFSGVVRPDERFALCVCNPPFHSSAEAAAAGTARKVRNLGSGTRQGTVLNFGGQNQELWCQGGEIAFIRRLIHESAARPEICRWFTTLVSKSSALPLLQRSLAKTRVCDCRVVEMTQGQKKSRLLAWTFQTPADRKSSQLFPLR